MHPVRVARHFGRLALRRAFPTPEEAAWRRLLAYAETAPAQPVHRLTLLDLDLEFPDPHALATQWYDVMVKRSLMVSLDTDSPRVLDCGAHIGMMSLWARRQWPNARLTAFEPDAAIAAMLRRNLERNAAADVEVIEAALWSTDGSIAFRSPGNDAGAIDDVGADTEGPLRSVRAVRLRDWLTEPIDFLKIDVEGAELDVLEDAADLLSRVRTMHIEIHDFDRSRRLLPRCLLRLEAAGFTYALSDLASATWRNGVRAQGPFADAVPSWVICVRAWRER